MPGVPLTKILETAPGVKKDGAAFVIAEETDANVFVTLGQEVLQIPRLMRVELGGDLATFVTHKGERFYFPLDQIAGVRLGGEGVKAGRTNAGFLKGDNLL